MTPLPSSSCGKLQYGGSGSPQFIIASDLPLQGANRALTTEMNKAIAYMLGQQGWKAGKYTVGFQACDDSTAQKGSWDSSKCTANANAYAQNTDGDRRDRHVQLGLREARDPDRQPRAERPARHGQPVEHLPGPDGQRRRHRAG